jgi:hypothetical protein
MRAGHELAHVREAEILGDEEPFGFEDGRPDDVVRLAGDPSCGTVSVSWPTRPRISASSMGRFSSSLTLTRGGARASAGFCERTRRRRR